MKVESNAPTNWRIVADPIDTNEDHPYKSVKVGDNGLLILNKVDFHKEINRLQEGFKELVPLPPLANYPVVGDGNLEEELSPKEMNHEASLALKRYSEKIEERFRLSHAVPKTSHQKKIISAALDSLRQASHSLGIDPEKVLPKMSDIIFVDKIPGGDFAMSFHDKRIVVSKQAFINSSDDIKKGLSQKTEDYRLFKLIVHESLHAISKKDIVLRRTDDGEFIVYRDNAYSKKNPGNDFSIREALVETFALRLAHKAYPKQSNLYKHDFAKDIVYVDERKLIDEVCLHLSKSTNTAYSECFDFLVKGSILGHEGYLNSLAALLGPERIPLVLKLDYTSMGLKKSLNEKDELVVIDKGLNSLNKRLEDLGLPKATGIKTSPSTLLRSHPSLMKSLSDEYISYSGYTKIQ